MLTAIEEDAIAAARERGEFLWLDLEAPPDAEVERLGELFGLHPLAIEDSRNFGQRPKVEDYGAWLLLVFHAAAAAGPVEVHLYLSGDWLATVHRAPCAALGEARRRIAARPDPGEQLAVYLLLDALTDTWFPVVDALDDEIEDLEEDALAARSDGVRGRILDLRRRLLALRRVAAPQRDAFPRALEAIAELPGLEADGRAGFRDVQDHLVRIAESLDGDRDLLSTLLDVHLAAVSNRLGVVTTQLTVVATVFLPLTFLTGFFGQNFGWLVNRIGGAAQFFGLGIGLLVVSVAAMLVWFRRRGVAS